MQIPPQQDTNLLAGSLLDRDSLFIPPLLENPTCRKNLGALVRVSIGGG